MEQDIESKKTTQPIASTSGSDPQQPASDDSPSTPPAGAVQSPQQTVPTGQKEDSELQVSSVPEDKPIWLSSESGSNIQDSSGQTIASSFTANPPVTESTQHEIAQEEKSALPPSTTPPEILPPVTSSEPIKQESGSAIEIPSVTTEKNVSMETSPTDVPTAEPIPSTTSTPEVSAFSSASTASEQPVASSPMTSLPEPSIEPAVPVSLPQEHSQESTTGIFTSPIPETNPQPVEPMSIPTSAPTPSPVTPIQAATPTGDYSFFTPPPSSAPPMERGGIMGFLGGKMKLIIGGIITVVIIIILILVFMPKRPASEKISLTYWGLWEDAKIMNTVIQEFQRDNPNIVINYIKQDPKLYSDRLLARIPDGTGPDIYRYHNSWVPMLRDKLLPLSNEVIEKEEFKRVYYPVIQRDLVVNGAIYGIPLEIDTLALFVNENIFKATGVRVPQTWAEFKDAAPALTVKDADKKIKTAGAAMGTYDNITHGPDIMSALFIQNGADVYKLKDTASYAESALAFYQGFAEEQQDNVWDASLDRSQIAFSKGNLAMYFGYSWDVFEIKVQNPNLNFKVYPIPHLPGRNISIASYWVEGISARTKYPKEAMLFMKFLAKKETAEKLYTEEAKVRLFGEPYARIDMADKLKDNPYAAPFIEQAATAQSTIFYGETHDNNFDGKLNGYLGNAIRSSKSNITTEKAIETLSQGVSQVLSQYGIR